MLHCTIVRKNKKHLQTFRIFLFFICIKIIIPFVSKYTFCLYICKKIDAMERMRIPVKVNPIIKEFLIDTVGSNVITPRKNDLIWAVLKQNLETVPAEGITEPDEASCIYVELLDCHDSKTWCIQKNTEIHVNSLFRWYLSEKGQNRINKILRSNFKSQLHSFVMGAVACNPELQQKEAMEQFCEIHNLSMQKITPDMIKKSWDRSEHKAKLNDKSICVNVLFM